MRAGFNEHHTIPRDITAANVVFRKGVEYKPKIKSHGQIYSEMPHQLRNLKTLPEKVVRDPNFIDYTGKKVGDFTVVGLLFLHDCYNKWVLRCVCGAYEIRRTAKLKITNLRKDQSCCLSCMDLERLKHKEYFRIHGVYPWQDKRKERC